MAQEFEAPLLARTNSGSVIVFDFVKQTLSIANIKRIDSTYRCNSPPIESFAHEFPVKRVTKVVRAPQWEDKISIYTDRDDTDTKRLIATLNLGKLGFVTTLKRRCNQIKEVFVVDEEESIDTPAIKPLVASAA